jgi:GDP-4-dehydro-6-deoxy-D-mannose reductase
MKILVYGANGFVGRSIVAELERDHEVWRGVRGRSSEHRAKSVNLQDLEAVARTIEEVAPEVIINAAGIVENTEASALNVRFTRNILLSIIDNHVMSPPKVIICGSAAEYGYVKPENIPVSEDCPTVPFSIYGINKHKETRIALKYGSKYGIDVVVARIFNPIGTGMAQKFIIPRLLAQIKSFTKEDSNIIEISRKDSVRDYIDVRDLSAAFRIIVENKTTQRIYNLGSGIGTTNEDLVNTLLQQTAYGYDVTVVESSNKPERAVASQADIKRFTGEFDWKPKYSLKESLEEIINEQK